MDIRFENVVHRYEGNASSAQIGLSGLNATFRDGCFTAILGASGSGKSTLLQHLNGLLLPSEGAVTMLEYRLTPPAKEGRKEKKARAGMLAGLRKRVGLVFQFPEKQLFESTVQDELMFGPLNFGVSKAEAAEAAAKAATALGLEESLLQRSPFELSGGQMRKTAIAAVLAADPDILVLDEPAASLDQGSREELLELLSKLVRDEGKTVIMVTHRLEEVLPYAEQYVVLDSGKAVIQGDWRMLFSERDRLAEAGIALPPSVRLLSELSGRFAEPLPDGCWDPAIAAGWIHSLLSRAAERPSDKGEAVCAQG